MSWVSDWSIQLELPLIFSISQMLKCTVMTERLDKASGEKARVDRTGLGSKGIITSLQSYCPIPKRIDRWSWETQWPLRSPPRHKVGLCELSVTGDSFEWIITVRWNRKGLQNQTTYHEYLNCVMTCTRTGKDQWGMAPLQEALCAVQLPNSTGKIGPHSRKDLSKVIYYSEAEFQVTHQVSGVLSSSHCTMGHHLCSMVGTAQIQGTLDVPSGA